MSEPTEKLRSNCPVNFGLETFGDKWSLLIVRDMVFWGKKTYSEFLNSDEGIATNILASRLAQLEKNGILIRKPHPADKRKDQYSLTEKGLELIPLLVEIVAWSGKLIEWQSVAGGGTPEQIKQVKRFAETEDKRRIIREIRESVLRGGHFFEGVTQPVTPRKRRSREMRQLP
ncbi:MAG: helix-turn-helix domain-containing protein [Pyrinomonadaceae bacterium]|nr:helix-turn-helix domain-containing protein [Pyrinomonadaceae bacterium]